MNVKTKDFRFEVKSLGEDGTFSGVLSVYGVVDLGGDLVEPGAFTKTINENPKVPLLWQHDTESPIGQLTLYDNGKELTVEGTIATEIQKGAEAYSLLKRNFIKGLSIGYQAIKHERKGGIRHLKEIRLFEGSVVTFPMLPLAQVTAVKAGEAKGDFASELETIQNYAMRRMIMEALERSLDSTLWDGYDSVDAAQIVEQSGAAIDQFRDTYMAFLPTLLEMWGIKGKPTGELFKSLRSRDDASALTAAIEKQFSALTTGNATAAAADGTKTRAAASETEPQDLHSWLKKAVTA